MIIWHRSTTDGTHIGTDVIVGQVYHFNAFKHGRRWGLRCFAVGGDDSPMQCFLGNKHRTLGDAKKRAATVALTIRLQREAAVLA